MQADQPPRGRPRARCIALAATLCAGVAPVYAQSSVSLYGVIDTSIEVTNPGSSWTPRMDSGAYRGSRFGIRGSEDIGGGTQILFTLENGFSSADGSFATAGSMFNRQAWIGASGKWGQVRVGRQYSPIYIPFKGQLDAFGAGTIASGLNNLSKITPYSNNAFTYISPNLYGLTGTVMLALRDAGAGNGLGGNYETLAYKLGPLKVLYAHQQTTGTGALRSNLGGVSYVMGKSTGFLSFFNGDGGTPRYHHAGVSISGRYAFTHQWRASLGYAYMRDQSGNGNNADQFSLASEYDLSKQLTVYASAGWLRNHGKATLTLRGVNVTGLTPAYAGAPVRGVQIGIIDRF
ncbi:porin [Robbsia sp. KACC 23696]|uniref:porin n=1 Tax=Robbsia sp. KACC 23696 TaxID=3149231 RepID=UPI00325AFA6A